MSGPHLRRRGREVACGSGVRHRPEGVVGALAVVALLATASADAAWLWFAAAAGAAYSLAASP